MWTKRWGYLVAKTKTPGVYRLKTGGFFVRARITDPVTLTRKEITAVLADAKSPRDARLELDRLVDAEHAVSRGEIRLKQTWRAFAISRLDERVRKGKMQSESTVDGWKDAIKLFSEEWGHLDAPAVTKHHINLWLNTKVAKWMKEGRTVLRKRRPLDAPKGVRVPLVELPVTKTISPVTVNNWLRILRAISHAIRARWDLAKSAFDGVEFFEEPEAYSAEEPNALPPAMMPMFMAIALAKHRQHFAMILLGFVTGLRPSHIRPLRRSGPKADLDWETGVLQVRRSHSRRHDVMNRTKMKKSTTITLPTSVLDVLRNHVATLTEKQLASELLFPSEDGKLRSRGVLTKPFAAIGRELGLTFRLTPRGMRRTFQDLMREAGIDNVVTRSISAHASDEMRVHYSTAQQSEQRAALEKAHAVIAGITSKGEKKGEGSTT